MAHSHYFKMRSLEIKVDKLVADMEKTREFFRDMGFKRCGCCDNWMDISRRKTRRSQVHLGDTYFCVGCLPIWYSVHSVELEADVLETSLDKVTRLFLRLGGYSQWAPEYNAILDATVFDKDRYNRNAR